MPEAAWAQAPTFNFALQAVGTGGFYAGGYVNRTVMDAVGNTYVVGDFANNITLGTTTLSTGAAIPNGGYTAFVAKIDPAGQYLWATQVSGGGASGACLALDSGGNILVTGFYNNSTAVFGNTTLSNPIALSSNAYVAKLSPTGQWLWAVDGGGSANDFATGVAVDAVGNAFVTGTFNGTATFGTSQLISAGDEDVFVARLTPTGQWSWAVRGGGTSRDKAFDIATDAVGNSYFTGNFRSAVATFGTTALTNLSTVNQSDDIFVAKLSSTGAWLWATIAGGTGASGFSGTGIPGDDWARAIAVDEKGNAYVTGSFYSSQADFGGIRLANSAPLGSTTGDTFVAKINAVGQFVWANSAGGTSHENGSAISLGPGGTVLCTGSYSSYASPPVAFGFITLPAASGQLQAYVACLDSIGAWRWALSAGGNRQDWVGGIAANANGAISIGGRFLGTTASFGSFTLSNSSTSSQQNIFVAQLAGGTPPLLRTISPATVPIGAGAQVVVMTGSGFTSASIVRLQGQVMPSTFVSTTEIRATIPAAVMLAAGRYNMVVTTPILRGGSATGTLPFAVQAPLTVHNSSSDAPLVIYPNPSPGQEGFTLVLPKELSGTAIVYINNVLGQQVLSQILLLPDSRTVKVHGLPPGVFQVQVLAENKVLISKVIIE